MLDGSLSDMVNRTRARDAANREGAPSTSRGYATALPRGVALCGEVLRAAYVTNTVTRTKPTPNIAADNASDETPITNHSDRVTVFS